MITKITLENFMAHERTELELGPGVNALTGPNNSGKSAVVEGLRCIATNPVPKHYIRHGAKEARVGVEFEDGTRVVWIRKKRSSGYELWHPGAEEPEEYWKFGRKPPEDVLDALKLDLVELETGSEVDVHVGNQREPVFLLNQPGSNAAAFFAASTESAHLLAMQNLLKRKSLDAKREKKGLEARLGVIEERMDRFAPLPSIGVDLETAQKLDDSAKNLEADMPRLEGVITAHNDLSVRLKSRKASATILNTLKDSPKLNDTSGLFTVLQHLSVIDKGVTVATEMSTVLGGLGSVPPVEDTRGLAMLCEGIQRTERALQQASKSRDAFGVLSVPPICQDVGQLPQILDYFYALRCRSQREDKKLSVLQNLVEPPAIESEASLQGLIGDMEQVCSAKAKVEKALVELEKGLQSLEGDIAGLVDRLGRCPTCGSEMTGVEFLDRRHLNES